MIRPLALAALLAGCQAVPTPDDAVIVRDVSLSALGVERVAGVAVRDDDGAAFVLGAEQGLFAVVDDELTLVADPDALMREGADLRPYTDVTSLEDGSFAVTVENDGLRLDVEAQTTTQHFCYLPGSMPVEARQLTHAVAFDAQRGLILAQPQTFRDDELTRSDVGVWNGDVGGEPENFFGLEDQRFEAHGMIWDEDRLVLAVDDLLYSYTLGDDEAVPWADLRKLGVEQIEGLALREDDTLVLVDGGTGRLLEITDWRVK